MTSRKNSLRQLRRCTVISTETVGNNIFVVRFQWPELAVSIRPGQFINVKVSDGHLPLLRRPFSVYRTYGETVEIIFSAVGAGTRILASKKAGKTIDVLGPLGVPYNVDDDYDVAILIAGGLGVAPLPILTDALKARRKTIWTFLGARSGDQLVINYLENVSVSTDDGSVGFHGTVVELAEKQLRSRMPTRSKIFACGPNAMLKGVAVLASSFAIPAEVSVECAMACGFGVCQGCPIERSNGSGGPKYYLVCKDGPVFNTDAIIFD